MLILIAGLLPYDSGKTTFAEALIEDLVRRNFDVGVSKPVSSVNCWYHYRYVCEAINNGILAGADTIRLHRAAKSNDSIEIEGPVTILLVPPDPEVVGWDSTIYSSIGFHNQVSVIRVTSLKESKYYYIPHNLQKSVYSLRRIIETFITDKNPEEIEIVDVDELLVRSRKYADECLSYLVTSHDVVVVESYNNAAAPTEKSIDADIVFVVAPGKAAVFRGDDFRKAIFAVSTVKEPWKVTVDEVVQLAHPEETFELSPGRIQIDSTIWI